MKSIPTMRNEEGLFALIKSLNPSEKRYFKIFVKGNDKSKNNRYQYLFDEILKQKIYDEFYLIDKLGYAANPNGFSVAKNYLYQLLLRSLRNYNNNSRSVKMQVAELLIDIEVLFRKGLYKNCHKLIQKGTKLASRHELLAYMLILVKWEAKICIYLTEPIEQSKKYDELFIVYEKFLYSLKKRDELESLFLKVKVKGELEVEADIKKIEALSLNNQNIKSRYAYFGFYNIYFRSLRQKEKCYQNNYEALIYFQEVPNFVDNYLELYIEVVYNYLRSLLSTDRYEAFYEQKDLLLELKISSALKRLRLLQDCLILNLMSTYYIYTGQLGLVVEQILPRYNTYLEQRIQSRYMNRELWIMGMISWGLLASKKHEESFEWLMKAEQYVDRNFYEDQYLVFRFVALALHFELKNFRLMDSINKSLQRFMDIRKKDNPVEITFLKFSRRVANPFLEEQDRREALRKLRAKLLGIERNLMERSTIKVYNLINWINYNLGDPARYYSLDALGK